MIRKITYAVIVLLLMINITPVAMAEAALPMIVDNADVLSTSEERILEERAQKLRSEYELDVAILTVDSLEGKSAQDYADDYYDSNGYGYDENGDGILFLLAMNEREWYISTCGDTIYAITDYGIQELGETTVWYLSEGYYFDGFYAYLDTLPSYLIAYTSGAPIDGYADYSGDYHTGYREETIYYDQKNEPDLLLSLIIGIVAATVITLILRASMNTKRAQHGASSYLQVGSFHLRGRQDMFLYSNVSKVRRQQNNTGSHGGGSSVHHSSGGRRHGGGGGRF